MKLAIYKNHTHEYTRAFAFENKPEGVDLFHFHRDGKSYYITIEHLPNCSVSVEHTAVCNHVKSIIIKILNTYNLETYVFPVINPQ